MSLIICPECGKQISDKTTTCIHCGCPIKKDENPHISKKFVYMCMSNSCLSNPFKEFNEYKEEVQICPDCGKQLEYYETEIIDNNTNLVIKRSTEESQEDTNSMQLLNIPKCPTCSSTDVKKIGSISKVAGAVTFGIFSKTAKSQFKCNSCGYKW